MTHAMPLQAENSEVCQSGWRRQFGHPQGWLGRWVGRLMAMKNRAMCEAACTAVAPASGEHILEIGCGPGVLLRMLSETEGVGSVTGIDLSCEMVQQARRRTRGRAVIEQGRAESLPFADRSFDALVAVNTVQHWTDREQGLAEAVRVLRPGGRMVVVVRAESLPHRAWKAPGFNRDWVDALATQLDRVGLVLIDIEEKPVAGRTAYVLTSVVPGGA